MNEKALKRALDYVQGWLELKYQKEDIPGFSIAVAHKGKVLLNQSFGYANLEKHQKLTSDHLFRIASHSKTFTATAIMQLQEKGLLRIDDYIVKYLPWLKDHKDKRWQKVSIRQLLSHSAGVIRDGESNNYWQLFAPFPDTVKLKADILTHGLVIEANTKMKYSNYGYSLLGMLIQAVSGKTYHEYVTESIVKTLGLKNSGPELTNEVKSKMVTGYTRADYPGKKHLPIENISTNAMAAATGFYSNAADLCEYFSAHIVGSGKLLNDESKKEMQRTQWNVENTEERTEYGLGFEIEYANDRRLFGHGGGFPGNLTNSLCDAQNDLVIVVLTNANGSVPGHIGKSLFKIIDFFQENWHGGNVQWSRYEGRYINLWWRTEVVALKDKLVASYISGWEPFAGAEELTHQKDNTFKISKADGFSSLEENVEFIMDGSSRVKSVSYAGGTMLPEDVFLRQTAKDGIIKLKEKDG